MKFPLCHVIFEITQECNLSCLYCYNYWRGKGHIAQQYEFKSAQKTLKRILNIFDLVHITFTGGEPFLAEGFSELILKCRLKGKGVTVISNGTVAAEPDYRILSMMGVTLFEFPLHSDNPAIHDKMTNSVGSFNKVIESIGCLQELKTDVCVVCVLTKLNIESLRDTLHFAQQLGVRRFMLARFNIGGRGIENSEMLLPSLEQLKSAFRIADCFAQKNKMKITANVCVPECIIDPSDYPHIPVSSCGSDFLKKPVTIDSSGNVRFCNHSPVKAGNIFSESMDSIFNSEYARSWKNDCPPYCSGCKSWDICHGGCRAASEQLYGSLNHEDPIIGLLKRDYLKNSPAD
ncbi:MAG: radical SAM protein [Fibrobacter sp.]|nr:radical SAM protein [Fibrobacter sp.]